jgi:hypothetical protein
MYKVNFAISYKFLGFRIGADFVVKRMILNPLIGAVIW